MTDPMTLLAGLERPALLMSAARNALSAQGVCAATQRLLHGAAPRGPAEALLRLIELERLSEEARRAEDAAYSPARHVTLLAAMLGQARLIGRPASNRHEKASETSPLRRAT